MALFSEFIAGSVFGAALLSAGVYMPSVIKSQMTFSSNVMITVMMGASATSAVMFDLVDRFGWLAKTYRKPCNFGLFMYDGNVIGGAMIGIGMGATGACPGTVLVQVGTGVRQAGFVALGGIMGAMAFLRLQSAITEAQSKAEEVEAAEGSKRPRDIATATGISQLSLLGVWMLMCLAVIGTVLRKDNTVGRIPAAGLIRPIYGGLLIGLAQLSTIVCTKHALGCSAAYQDIASWMDEKLLRRSTNSAQECQSFLTPPVTFAVGVICASVALGRFAEYHQLLIISESTSYGPLAASLAVAGGACMLFGARLAGGCTSGHGISGLAKFDLSSLVTTASMFAGGVVTATAIKRIASGAL